MTIRGIRRLSAGGSPGIIQQYGNSSHHNAPLYGDYDGDAKTDIAMYDQTIATFYVSPSGGIIRQ